MMRLEWNALRVGDRVLVHDAVDPERHLLPGTVAVVETTAGASNDVGVRVAYDAARTRVLRPKRLAVHLDPRDSTEDCWRCDSAVAGDAHGRRAAS